MADNYDNDSFEWQENDSDDDLENAFNPSGQAPNFQFPQQNATPDTRANINSTATTSLNQNETILHDLGLDSNHAGEITTDNRASDTGHPFQEWVNRPRPRRNADGVLVDPDNDPNLIDPRLRYDTSHHLAPTIAAPEPRLQAHESPDAPPPEHLTFDPAMIEYGANQLEQALDDAAVQFLLQFSQATQHANIPDADPPAVAPGLPGPSPAAAAAAAPSEPADAPASSGLPPVAPAQATRTTRPASAAQAANPNEMANSTLNVTPMGPVTIWAIIILGVLTTFARHQRGLQKCWMCMLCDKCTTPERGRLTNHLQKAHGLDANDLKYMALDDPNNLQSNATIEQRFGQNGFFEWAHFEEGDPLPWKCSLCKDPVHKGIKCGHDTLGRHMAQIHGIKVMIPPVGKAKVDLFRQRKARKGTLGRQMAALARSFAAAQAAEAAASAKRSADEAGLDENDGEEDEDEEMREE